MTPQRQIALDLIDRFPKAGSKTLARMALRDNPSVYPSMNAADCQIRRLRGQQGDWHRKKIAPECSRPRKAPSLDPFGKIPEGLTHFEDWQALKISGPAKALILSDIHIPYHDKPALMAALEWAKKASPNLILLNGDIADFFSVSFWEKDPRERDFKNEVDTTKEFLQALRKQWPRARIIFKEGNHEERWTRYMFCKAPEVLGLPEFETSAVLGLDTLGIESVGEKRPIKLGDLNVIHGHEYRFAIQNPVNPARGLFLRAKAYALCGHFHQSSYHPEKTVEEKVIACWSAGCLCDMHPDFMPLNKWNHGFAFVDVAANGKFEVSNLFISGGRVWNG